MIEHELKELIRQCDLAIKNEEFDTLMNYYTDEAILVVKPGMIARGKTEIKKAFIAIAKYFNNSLVPEQGEWLCAIDNSYGTELINNINKIH